MVLKIFGFFSSKSTNEAISPEMAQAFERAERLHQEGQLLPASTLYRSVLEHHPDHWESLNAVASIALKNGELKKAALLYGDLIRRRPELAEAHYNEGNALNGLGQFEQAVASYDRAIFLDPHYANALCNRGAALERLGRWPEALACFDRALVSNPADHLSYVNRGSLLRKMNRLDDAVASYDGALAIKGDYVEAHFYRGTVLQELTRHEEAIASYDKAIEFTPDGFLPFMAYCCRGFALSELRRFEEALVSYERAIHLKPDYFDACFNRAVVLQGLGRYEDAAASYRQATKLLVDDLSRQRAHANLGFVLAKVNRFDDALESFESVVALGGGDAQSYVNLGSIQLELCRYESAAESYERAMSFGPGKALAFQALCGRGFALKEIRRFEEARACYERAMLVTDDDADAHMHLGGILQELDEHQAAITSYERAIVLQPGHAGAFAGRGFSFLRLKRFEESVESFSRSIALDADQKYLEGFRQHARMQSCDWEGMSSYLEGLREGLADGRPVCAPFQVLAMVDSARAHRQAAEIWVQQECPADDSLGSIPARPRAEKIRIGYFSADFRYHPVSLLAAGLFETHDRSKFETTAFVFGPESNDAVRQRLERAFDRFIDVRGRSDVEVAMLARDLGIDIAVDLGGFTEGARTKILALRAAPVQVGYLGYLGTMGAPYMDYILADSLIIPADFRHEYREKIIYLPSYQVNDSQRRISDRLFSREELGLPPEGFVFCCFNANYKITPDTFAVWMRILARVGGSSLVLVADNLPAERNLALAAERAGIEPRRIVFAKRVGLEDYLARFRSMDLFLDTLPYNAGTTASDALWAGLPVLTCLGAAFSGRVAGSVLSAIGLPELITETSKKYEDLAVQLACSPATMEKIRTKLAGNRLVAPLFDTLSFTRNLEYAYEQIYERSLAGLPPDHVPHRS